MKPIFIHRFLNPKKENLVAATGAVDVASSTIAIATTAARASTTDLAGPQPNITADMHIGSVNNMSPSWLSVSDAEVGDEMKKEGCRRLGFPPVIRLSNSSQVSSGVSSRETLLTPLSADGCGRIRRSIKVTLSIVTRQ